MAIMAVEVLTSNRPPISGASRRWLLEALRWPVAAQTPRHLVDLLQRCTAESVSERLKSVDEFRAELIPLLKSCPPLAGARAVGANGGETVVMPV